MGTGRAVGPSVGKTTEKGKLYVIKILCQHSATCKLYLELIEKVFT